MFQDVPVSSWGDFGLIFQNLIPILFYFKLKGIERNILFL